MEECLRIALDTNRYVDFCRNESGAIDINAQAERIYLPFIVLGELRAGFLGGSRSRRNEEILTRFLGKPRVRVLHSDDGTTHHFASIYNQLKKQGTPIPTNDLWIAALVIQHNLQLFARDDHFNVLPQLSRI